MSRLISQQTAVQALLAGAVESADYTKARIEQTADSLLCQMQELHGSRNWQALIDHDCMLVMIVARNETNGGTS